jgi:hypothetical protein
MPGYVWNVVILRNEAVVFAHNGDVLSEASRIQ